MGRVVAVILMVLVGLAAVNVFMQSRQPRLGTEETLPTAAVSPGETYDPVRAGEPLPSGFRQLLRRDDIRPVYEPTFNAAARSSWDDSDLVIGVALGDQAKAYPVAFLNWREMVVDSISGVPILVTW